MNACRSFLSELQVKISAGTLRQALRDHPDYPSLLAVSDVLNEFRINNISLKTSPENLHELPVPFIAQIKEWGKDYFVTVKAVEGEQVAISNLASQRWEKVSVTSFLQRWSGVALWAEPREDAGEHGREENRKAARFGKAVGLAGAFALLVVLAVAGLNFYQAFGAGATGLMLQTLLKTAGIGIAGLLLVYEVDQYNPAIQSICKATQHVNCGAVLGSGASKLAGGLVSWSELGFMYFAGTFALLFLSSFSPALLHSVFLLSLAALPYILFSIYYQWRVVRQWCLLCLSVQAVLLAEGIAVAANPLFDPAAMGSISAVAVFTAIAALLAPGVVWYLVKPFLLAAREKRALQSELAKIKYNPFVFEQLLSVERTIDIPATGVGLTLGNPEGRHKVVKVCNPYCGPCARAHTPLEEALRLNADLQVRIIFTAKNDESDRKFFPVRHFMALAEQKGPATLHQALDAWYGAPVKDYEAFAARFPVDMESETLREKVAAMRKWCDDMEISYTPSIFYNGKLIPKAYNAQDLKYFLM